MITVQFKTEAGTWENLETVRRRSSEFLGHLRALKEAHPGRVRVQQNGHGVDISDGSPFWELP